MRNQNHMLFIWIDDFPHSLPTKKSNGRYHDAINYIRHLHECKVGKHDAPSNHLSSIEASAECQVLQETKRDKKH